MEVVDVALGEDCHAYAKAEDIGTFENRKRTKGRYQSVRL
jgi:hypothetical protein